MDSGTSATRSLPTNNRSPVNHMFALNGPWTPRPARAGGAARRLLRDVGRGPLPRQTAGLCRCGRPRRTSPYGRKRSDGRGGVSGGPWRRRRRRRNV